jgi:hypothetical protein
MRGPEPITSAPRTGRFARGTPKATRYAARIKRKKSLSRAKRHALRLGFGTVEAKEIALLQVHHGKTVRAALDELCSRDAVVELE